MTELIAKVKEKREFSKLPNSIVERALTLFKYDVKETRAYLRKYFGVFLTNKVLRLKDSEILKSHISSKKRDYSVLYSKILGNEKSVLDLGCGVNGFSYEFFPNKVNYTGVEASGQIVEKMNKYFGENKFKAKALSFDLFENSKIKEILESMEKPRTVFLFQVIDALESIERDSSKELLMFLKDSCEKIVLSFSLKSISGRNRFFTDRKWILDFLKENFKIIEDFEMFDERFLVLRKD